MRLRFDRQSWYRARSFSAEARSCCGCPKIDPVRKDQWQRLMGGGQEDASACQMNLHKAAEQLERSGIKPIGRLVQQPDGRFGRNDPRSEEHTSELQSLMRISYAVLCLKKKITTQILP